MYVCISPQGDSRRSRTRDNRNHRQTVLVNYVIERSPTGRLVHRKSRSVFRRPPPPADSFSLSLNVSFRSSLSPPSSLEMIGFELTLIEAATVQQVLRATKVNGTAPRPICRHRKLSSLYPPQYVSKDETREMLHVNEVIVSASNSMTSLRIRLDDADPMEVQRLDSPTLLIASAPL